MKRDRKAMTPRDRMVLWGMEEIGRLRKNGADERMLKTAERAWKRAIRSIYPRKSMIGIGTDIEAASAVSELLAGRNITPIRKTDFRQDGSCPRQASMYRDGKTGRFYDGSRVTVTNQYGISYFGAFPEFEDAGLISGIRMPYVVGSDCHSAIVNTFTYDRASGKVIMPESADSAGFNAMEVIEVDGRGLEEGMFFVEGERWDASDAMKAYVRDRIEQDLVKKGFILP